MSADRDTTRIVRSWLEGGVTQLPDRVLDAVLDQVPTTQQRRRQWPLARRPKSMSNFVRYGAVAAALLAFAVVAASFLPLEPIAPGTTTPLPTASATATPMPFPQGTLSAGTHRYAIPLPHASVDAVVTLDPGWTSGGWSLQSGDVAIAFFTPQNVNGNACDQEGTLPSPSIGPSVDDFLTALSAQKNSDMTTPTDVTIAGVAAKRFEISPSADAPCPTTLWWREPCCGDPAFRGTKTDPERAFQPDTVWVLMVDGQRVAVVGYWNHVFRPQGTKVEEVVNSLEFVSR